MRARSFFYTTVGLFLLVATIAIVSSRAQSQTPQPGKIVEFMSYCGGNTNCSQYMAITETGDVYGGLVYTGPTWNIPEPWVHAGNIFTGTVQVQGKSMSEVKGTYRGK